MGVAFKERLMDQWGRAHGQTPALAFLAGLGADILTLGRIDEPRNVILQIVYLVLAALTLIAALAEKSSWVNTGPRFKRVLARLVVRRGRFVFHFATGALLSAFTFFYFKSSSGFASLMFLVALAIGLVLNELPRFKRLGAVFRATLFQLSLVSFLTYILPMVVGELHIGLFAVGIGLSALVVVGLSLVLQALGVEKLRLNSAFRRPAFGVTLVFIALYVLQWIPPIPLSVQEMVVAHKVERVGEAYQLTVDASDEGRSRVSTKAGQRVYVFVRIFAPRNFSEEVFLRWERRDPGDGWVETDRIRLPIRGGRTLGFRGYTYKENFEGGRWRVFVETEDGREVGRLLFEIHASSPGDEVSRTLISRE